MTEDMLALPIGRQVTIPGHFSVPVVLEDARWALRMNAVSGQTQAWMRLSFPWRGRLLVNACVVAMNSLAGNGTGLGTSSACQ